MVKGHNERCKLCKTIFKELLAELYGEVKVNYNLDLPSKIIDYEDFCYGKVLAKIYKALQEYRGYNNFVKANKLPNVDFYIPNHGVIIEFDESQHFSNPRKIALENYPNAFQLGFDRNKWIDLCGLLNKKDNDPPYRDEQRAWYDTLRDFAPSNLNLKPTIRLFAQDFIWCSLDPKNKKDIAVFKEILYCGTKKES